MSLNVVAAKRGKSAHQVNAAACPIGPAGLRNIPRLAIGGGVSIRSTGHAGSRDRAARSAHEGQPGRRVSPSCRLACCGGPAVQLSAGHFFRRALRLPRQGCPKRQLWSWSMAVSGPDAFVRRVLPAVRPVLPLLPRAGTPAMKSSSCDVMRVRGSLQTRDRHDRIRDRR